MNICAVDDFRLKYVFAYVFYLEFLLESKNLLRFSWFIVRKWHITAVQVLVDKSVKVIPLKIYWRCHPHPEMNVLIRDTAENMTASDLQKR